MINNSDIQEAWISKLKADRLSTDSVTTDEIREDSWKGTDFIYPNIRVKMGLLTPQVNAKPCQIFHSLVSIQVFSAEKSSKQANDMAGIIATRYWGRNFSSEGVRFVNVALDSLAPAEVPENNEEVWVSSVNFNALVQAA